MDFADKQQYGGAGRLVLPALNYVELGLYYYHYLARFPLMNLQMGGAPFPVLTLQYPETDMIGASFTHAIQAYDLNLQVNGELAYRPNEPLQKNSALSVLLSQFMGGMPAIPGGWGEANTLEGQICKIADIVAYVNHDIEDAVRAGIISQNDLPERVTATLGHTHSERINTLVCDVINYSLPVSGNSNLLKPAIGMSPEVLRATSILRQFLFDRIYNPSLAGDDAVQAERVLRLLYSHFLEHENRLPREFVCSSDDKERKVVDYIAGMTDHYALRIAEEISQGLIHESGM